MLPRGGTQKKLGPPPKNKSPRTPLSRPGEKRHEINGHKGETDHGINK